MTDELTGSRMASPILGFTPGPWRTIVDGTSTGRSIKIVSDDWTGRTPPLPPEREQMLRAEGRDGGRPPQTPQANLRPGSRFWRGAKGTGA